MTSQRHLQPVQRRLLGFPLLYPDAGVVDPRYYAYGVLSNVNPPYCQDGTRINLPPAFSWGSRDRRRTAPAQPAASPDS